MALVLDKVGIEVVVVECFMLDAHMVVLVGYFLVGSADGGKKSCSSRIHLFPRTSIIIDYFTPSSFPCL